MLYTLATRQIIRSGVKTAADHLVDSIFTPISSRSHFDGDFLVLQGIGYRFFIGHVGTLRRIVLRLTNYWFVGLLWCFFKSKMVIFEPGAKPIGILVMLILI